MRRELQLFGFWPGASGQSTPADGSGIAADGGVATRDTAVIGLIATGEEALAQARQRMPTAILPQVDFGPEPGMLTFRFTDAAATRTPSLTFTALGPDNGRWRAIEQGMTPLTGLTRPGMELGVLRTSPEAVRQAAVDNWPDCGPPGLTLGGTGSDLTWHVFCTIEASSVSGILDDSTGVFTPSPVPPVRPAPTAVPNQC